MDEPDILLDAAAPGDDAGWRVYADWLEERGDSRAEFVRLLVALGAGEVEPAGAEAAAGRLAALHKPLDREWLKRIIRLRADRPLRLRITDVIRMGNIPPREMFDRAMTIVTGVLEAGTVRVGQMVAVPRTDGNWTIERVSNLSAFNEDLESASAGQVAAGIGIMWPGHRVSDLGVQRYGVITGADPPADEA